MPELPEVEAARRQAEGALVGRRIERAQAAIDPRVFDRAPPAEVERALAHRLIVGTGRRGKYWWLVLDRAPHPVFHFGMSGRFAIDTAGSGPPPYCKLEVVLDNGTAAAIRDARRLGHIRLAGDPESEPPISDLGPDALTSTPTWRELGRLFAARRAPIKSVLLDQSVIAGVGNWVADEVLHEAGISPLRPANELSPAKLRRLHAALRSVLEQAVAVDADAERFPGHWLFHVRWDRRIGTTAQGEVVVRQPIGGRTTTWVPARQK
jgi:formamidopyrimidine-DNA glycosylase